ncbi:MAG TPA: MarR family transcriptional regulator [Mycobacteriales bacterium]|nr:MarR family transcriptional regulator [Mycobacteriales bacterium]
MTTATPTLAQAAAAGRLRAAIARLNRMLRQQTVGELTLSQWSALITLESTSGLRIGELADREHVSAPTATRLVASLEALGLVSRTTDATDRRSAVVAVTAAGGHAISEARRARTASLAGRLAGLSTDDLQRLLDALPVLERLSEDAPAA